jgi:hypothetical protein
MLPRPQFVLHEVTDHLERQLLDGAPIEMSASGWVSWDRIWATIPSSSWLVSDVRLP